MDFLAAIRRESDLFYATADNADPTLDVPSCPGWTIEDLVRHLGEVHWFWGTDIETRPTDPDSIEAAKPARPAGYQELIAWGRGQAERMISLLEQNDDTTTVWTWSPPDQTVGFIRRHQVQEAAVHRWDMQNAATQCSPDPIDPEVASDSIDELLVVTLPWGVSDKKRLPGRVHIHCMDTEGEWFIQPNGNVEPIHAKGDVALRGTASDLLLAAFKRVGINNLEVIGNEALAREFIERINTE
ncbi:MAG TPA: maleylpyruvate isomerase family mycothiol-dependent enzyme [Acidimicrobiales bacterium]|nr:maleylpyruvate isomerase family mycothiol-dependent enzyme [Acidimicrobiales bacterium]